MSSNRQRRAIVGPIAPTLREILARQGTAPTGGGQGRHLQQIIDSVTGSSTSIPDVGLTTIEPENGALGNRPGTV